MKEYEREQLDLPFDGSFRLMPSVNNVGMFPADVVIRECVPDWLGAHSPGHVHGETHVHFDACTWAPLDEYEALDGQGYIYFIQNTHDSLIKIGKSHNPAKRLRELQTGNGFELRLRAQKYCSKMLKMERYLHKRFEEDQMEGEWFLPSSSLLEYIGAL